jgi:hypothetical protein
MGRRELTRLNQINEDVPLLLLQDGRVGIFTDTDLVVLDDDLRAVVAPGAEPEPGRGTSAGP